MSAPDLGWLTWASMLAVLAAAAVLSFDALRDLAVLCGVEPRLAWLLPVAIDAGAAVSTRVWLSGRAVLAERYARNMTWSLLVVTVAGNALHSGLVSSGLTPTWWTAVVVGAVPPAVVGATVHLAVLVGRPTVSAGRELAVVGTAVPTEGAGATRTPGSTAGQRPEVDEQGWAPAPTPGEGSELVRTPAGEGYTLTGTHDLGTPDPDLDLVNGRGTHDVSTPATGLSQVQPGPAAGQILRRSSGVSDDDRAAALIAEGAGRRRLARELDITEHAARELLADSRGLLAESRNGHGPVAR